MIKSYLALILFLFLSASLPAQVNYTANDAGRVPAYTNDFYYGASPGAYNTWDDKAKADIAAGNPALNIKGAGVKSFHSPLPETFLETWGYDIRVNEYNYFASLGMRDNSIWLETPSAAHKDNNKYGGCTDESMLFKNLYEPIWDGGANGTPVNEQNYYALYVYKTVTRYKSFTKFWEVINEPDAGPKAFEPKGSPGNWWENAPSPCDLIHIKAPIYHYIRMLRITYDIVKSLDPTAYVSPSGIGSGSFLDALMRYTDNPVDGSVTAAYPAKGGAYFDALSFHFYPMYSLKTWTSNGYAYRRHTDAAITEYVNHKNYLENIMASKGYDGITYPKKIMICTENGVPHKAFGDYIGSDDAQKNYAMKALVESQKNDVKQFYLFILGDGTDESNASWEFDVMGLYKNLNNNGPTQGPGYLQKYNNAGIAYKTTSDLLSGFRYDGAKTAALNLPANMGGGAFVKNGEYRYVLWAKTTTDQSEAASATYSFPASTAVPASVKRREWNFTETGSSADISSQNIVLSGTPSFFLAGVSASQPPLPPVAAAGADISITLPVAVANLDGSQSSAPSGSITKYSWTYVSGPSTYTLATPAAASTTVSGLQQGTYIFRLTVTDNTGATGFDDVMITVNATIGNTQPPVANAGKDESIPVGQATVLHGENSTAPGGIITSYQWTKFSGPVTYEMLTASANTTWIRNMVAGTYVFRLTVTDNRGATSYDDVVITVGGGSPAPNQLPVARAGSDVTISLPVNTTTLSNAGSSDADGSITAYNWTQVSGPSQSFILSPGNSSSAINNLLAGTYIFRLTVTDNAGATAYDDVVVNVNAAGSGTSQPVANAGKDENIPVGQATVLHGESSTAPAGSIVSYAWTKYSGPSAFEMLTPASSTTWIRNMVDGVYVFRLSITDSHGASAFDDVVITVGKGTNAINVLPVSRAGNDISITLPQNGTTLSNAGSSDADGSITGFAWSQVSGPSSAQVASPSAASTAVNNLVAGTYTFRLTVTDNSGGSAYDDVVVSVQSNNNTTLPVANAGKDETIPVGQATVLHGESSYVPGGTITSYQWTRFSGPSNYEMLTPSGSATWIRNMIAGTYVYRLSVKDNNGNTAIDDVVITVLPLSGLAGKQPLNETDVHSSKMIIYPNPVAGSLNINWSSDIRGKGILHVYNSAGALMKSVNLSKDQQQYHTSIDVSLLKQGIYLLYIRMENGWVVSERVMKE